ncbi:hypothetical protein RQP46_010185 [Phenoliferia psychrophenolica]
MMSSPGMPWEMEEKVIRGIRTRTYKNLYGSLRDLWIASKVFAKRDHIVYEDERLTYEESHARVHAIALMLSETYGCKKGDRVAIVARNLPEWILSFWAIEVLGGVAVTVNAWLNLEAMEHCIKICDCRVVILDAERAKQLSGSVKVLESAGSVGILVYRTTAPPPGMRSFEEAVRPFEGSTRPLPAVEILPEDEATILFTSGTTGLPKGVLGTQRNYLTNIINTITGPTRAILRRGELPPAPDPNAPQKSVMISVPLFHATGNHSSNALATFLGGKICMVHKWSADRVADMIIREKCTSAGGIPFMAMELVEAFAARGGAPSLESVGFGGGPASGELPSEICKAIPSSMPNQGYGATEVSSAAATVSGEDFLLRPTSTGLACLVDDIKIVDENGKTLGPGQHGEIYIKGPNVCLEYVKNPKATKETFLADGYYRSGDIGYLDHEGFLYIMDRAKDIIIRGGENIASVTVENALYLDHRILDVAVVPIPDAKLGELVAAAVVTKSAFHGRIKEAELIALVAKTLPKHCIPVLVDIRTEILPRNGVGKTLKSELKVELAALWEERKKGRAKL